MTEIYDSIGTTYNTTRRADPRLEQVIWSALEGCGSVLNVGAGTGAYEPTDRAVVAVETQRDHAPSPAGGVGTLRRRHCLAVTGCIGQSRRAARRRPPRPQRSGQGCADRLPGC